MNNLFKNQVTSTILILLFFSLNHATPPDIDCLKTTIKTTLQKHNPQSTAQFDQFCQQYDNLVISFFDKKNHKSLKWHIQAMQTNLEILKQTASCSQFKSANTYLEQLHGNLGQMIKTLSGYVDSKNAIGLALKLQKFKFLLPGPLKKKGDLWLLTSLWHRLYCA